MKRILLFDTIIDGHHPDYLTHLIRYWLAAPNGELIVAAPASFEPVVARLKGEHPGAGQAVRFVALSQPDIERVHGSSPLRRSFREWNLQLRYARMYRPTHLLLMYFDVFQAGLWLGRRAICPVSGIYFRPDFHYPTPSGLKARLAMLRKRLILNGVLRQGVLANLFCLDHSVVAALRAVSFRTRILPLPDPVATYNVAPAEVTELRRRLGIEPGRRVLLLFGFLDERKGIEPLLDALKRLRPDLRSSVCLLLVGPIKPDYQATIDARLATLDPAIQVVCEYAEIKGRLIQTYFELADFVLALYQRHVGMASVVVRAGVSGKPVLASDYGYLGQLVPQQQLGAVADSTDPVAIGNLLERALTGPLPYSPANLRQLAEANSDAAFARTIFDNL